MPNGNHVKREEYHTYPPVGHCIYCGATDCDLSKEHIIPYSLNGNWALPKASCPSCQKKTHKIEEVCTHERYGMFAPMRHRLKMQSRSKSTRRREFLAEVVGPSGVREMVPFESDGFPSVAFGMRFQPAGILLGIEPSNECKAQIIFRTSIPSEGFCRRASLRNPYGAVGIGTFWPTAFLQLLAKIGYAFGAAELGTKNLLPMLADVILGKTDKSPYLVGGGGMTAEPVQRIIRPQIVFETGQPEMLAVIAGQAIRPVLTDVTATRKPYGHSLNIHTLTIRDCVFTVVIIHLFGCMGLPQYHVVVGQRQANERTPLDN